MTTPGIAISRLVVYDFFTNNLFIIPTPTHLGLFWKKYQNIFIQNAYYVIYRILEQHALELLWFEKLWVVHLGINFKSNNHN